MTPIEKPMLFTGPMVKAILEGRKTQTRRTHGLDRVNTRANDWNNQPGLCPSDNRWVFTADSGDAEQLRIKCPHPVGSRIWVRETWSKPECDCLDCQDCRAGVIYRADRDRDVRWHPSIFMPRKFSRITLEVTDVRVQRVQEITEDDARAEGCQTVVHLDGSVDCGRRKTTFARLWDSINAKPKPVYVRSDNGNKVISHYISYPWENINETRSHHGKPWYLRGNPWVWAYTFKEVQP